MKAIKFIIILFIGLSFSVNLYSEKLDLNTIKIDIDKEDFIFNANVSASVEKRRNGDVRIVIGAFDRIEKIKFFITADIEEMLTGNKFLDSGYNQIMIMFKGPDQNFIISPSIRLVKNSRIKYIKKNRSGKKNSHQPEKADWTSLNRRERISSGKGIVRNRRMEGTSFSLSVRPVFKNGKIVELIGTFSGIAKKDASSVRNRIVRGVSPGKMIIKGSFRIEVK